MTITRRATIVIIGVVAIILGITTAATAAYRTTPRSFDYDATATVVQAEFREQDDGTGVRAEGFWIDINQGCDRFESSGGRFVDLNIEIADMSPTYIVTGRYTQAAVYNCHVFIDLELKGADTGCSRFTVEMKARLNNYPDKWYEIGYNWCANPLSSDLLYKNIIDA